MDARHFILTQIHEACRRLKLDDDLGSPSWSDGALFRACALRLARGDHSAWLEFIKRLRTERELTFTVRSMLIDLQILRETSAGSFDVKLTLPTDVTPFSKDQAKQFLAVLDIWKRDQVVLSDPMAGLVPDLPGLHTKRDRKTFIPPSQPSRSEIMYIEMKPDLCGPGRIGRVQFSQTGKTIYYDGKKLQSLKGAYKANYFNVETGMWYWVSGCKKDGNDRLYPGSIEIDKDVREEYWLKIRKLPEKKHLTKFRSPGKYSKHRPA
ncbi:MAG TPA: hypothetical protein VFB96_17740 [Pirellulaceae bacterium]|nr:hypothetical protein [Pirellulaceae bacterium]